MQTIEKYGICLTDEPNKLLWGPSHLRSFIDFEGNYPIPNTFETEELAQERMDAIIQINTKLNAENPHMSRVPTELSIVKFELNITLCRELNQGMKL
jgi:hypothetical protein